MEKPNQNMPRTGIIYLGWKNGLKIVEIITPITGTIKHVAIPSIAYLLSRSRLFLTNNTTATIKSNNPKIEKVTGSFSYKNGQSGENIYAKQVARIDRQTL